MALCQEYLKQAADLARRRGRPSQINLRRAISAAYYAVFHLLIQEAVECAVPKNPPGLRARASRALQHGELREICTLFQRSSVPPKLIALLGGGVSEDLREVAKTFLDLQDQRHAADYDIALKLSQRAVLSSVANAETAFRQWRTMKGTPEANVFLTALIFGRRWDRG